jgi:hypothetical protein
MVSRPCHLEPFSSTPGYFTVRQCVRKQFEVHSQLAQTKPPRLAPDQPPAVWIFSPGRPEAALRRLGAAPAQDWPPGFYLCAEGWALGFVVLRELPQTRDTLVLRLLGPHPMRETAVQEIRTVPEGDPDREPLLDLLAALRHLVEHDKKIPEEERKAFMTAAMAEVLKQKEQARREKEQIRKEARNEGWNEGLNEGRKEGRKEGHREGHREGLNEGRREGHREGHREGLNEGRREGLNEGRREALRMATRGMCEVLGIELSAEREAEMAALDVVALEGLFAHLKQHRHWPAGTQNGTK